MKTHLVTVLIGLAACSHEAPRGAAAMVGRPTLASKDSAKDSVAVPPTDANSRPLDAKDLPDSMGEVLGVRLNRDSLISVWSRLGRTAEWETGDAGEAMVWWCYRLGGDTDRTIVTFGSSGEMGGPNHEVQDIRVTRWSRVGADSTHCSPAHTSQRPITPG